MKKLERFILRDILSDSMAGTVYRAEEILPGDNRRPVALKVLPPLTGNAVAEERFYAEVRVLAQLAVQPHVVTIYAMGVTEGYPWLAMEHAESTAQSLMLEDPGTVAEVVKLLRQVGQGLAAMHGLNPPLVHQDIKPANLLLDAGGNYKVTDFSLASVVAANRTHGMATVRYAAPEMLSSEFGPLGPATDLYSLGHVAYEMALGGRAHRAQFPAVFEGNATKEPPPNKWMMWHASSSTRAPLVHEVRRDFPPGLGELIGRLMAKSMAQRYGSAEEMLADLSGLRGESSSRGAAMPAVVAPPVQVAPPPPAAEEIPMTAAPAAPSTPRMPVAPAAAPSGGTKYYVRLRGRVSGPFDLATLQRQVRQGLLSRLHQLSADQVTWKSAADIEGLYGPTVV